MYNIPLLLYAFYFSFVFNTISSVDFPVFLQNHKSELSSNVYTTITEI